MMFDAFIGGSYTSEASTADGERCVNWYPEMLESPGASNQKALYPTPGVNELNTTAVTGYARAHFVVPCTANTCVVSASRPERWPPKLADGREFYIIGNTLYEADSTGAVAHEWTSNNPGNDNAFDGLVNPSTDRTPATYCGFDTSGQVFFTCGKKGYYFDATSATVFRVSAVDGLATSGAFLDGYFIVLDADNNKIYISANDDATSWTTGTDVATRSLAPDPWRAIKALGRYVWLFGEATTELWQDTGERFPLAPIPSALINYGIAAPWSAAVVDNTMVWLARDPSGRLSVVQAAGQNINIISTHAVELAISGYSDYSDAVAWNYSSRGHSFYVLDFLDSGATWVWDARTNQWHERGTWNTSSGAYTSWRPRYAVWAFGEHRVLDSGAGQSVGAGNPSGLYTMSTDYFTDIGGGVIRRLRRSPAIMNENKNVFYPGFELDLEPGLGTSGQGANPQVMMRMSDDGGKTWGLERWKSAGKTGEYKKRVRWDRLGSARRRVFETAVSDPIPWRLTGAYLNPDPVPGRY